MNARTRWMTAIIGMLSFPAVLYGVAFAIVSNDPSFRVDRGYKQRTESYDEDLRQRAVNQRLAWSADVAMEGGEVVVRPTDASSSPIVAATVEAEIFHAARSARSSRLALTEHDPGCYTIGYRPERAGQYVLRITIRLGNEVFTSDRRIWVDRTGNDDADVR